MGLRVEARALDNPAGAPDELLSMQIYRDRYGLAG
jgi:hypothetical protein